MDDLEFLFADEPPLEPDDSENHLGNEPDLPDIPGGADTIREPIHRTNSRHLRDKLSEDELVQKVKTVLACMRTEGLNLPIFLDAVCWGDPKCIADATVRYARTALMTSEELPGVLERCYNPPRPAGERPGGGRQALFNFAVQCISDAIDREMKISATLFLSPPEDLSEEHLTSLDFEDLKVSVQSCAPTLWLIFRRAAYTPLQETRNKHKHPDMVVLNMISQAQYTRSNRRGRVSKIWSIYLKACGLSARAFDALHALGILMSHKWTSNAVGTLSTRAMTTVQKRIHVSPWNISHDNINVALRAFSQRLNNQSHFISGCAYTVWILPDRAALPPEMNRLLQTYRAEHCLEVFEYDLVLYGNEAADDRMQAFDEDYVLRLLLDSPDFADYPHLKDQLFDPPPAVWQLQGGPENAIKPFILETSTKEEASYEGTLNVMADAFRQLLLDAVNEQMRTAIQRIIAWIGDQLTVERLRGLWKYRHEDHNSFDRLDYMIPIFGWFHLVMAFANSIHKQYLGNSAAIGSLRQAFDILKRKGLITQSTKGPFWHNLDEAIHHISEAHFRASWLDMGKVENLAELKSRSPAQLRELASTLIREHASREAVNKIEGMSPRDRDDVYRQWTMFNMDVLPYLQLRQAIKTGDVGRIEDLIPTLLFRFAGGGNPKYTIEMLELLQGLHREWPPGLRDHIREFCWLMSRDGGIDSWLPFDLGQEQNICDIKVNYRSMGPGATMEYMGKVSPAIPALRKVQRHMENQFKTTARGARHGVPDKEKDVAKLTAHYVTSKLHTYTAGRELKTLHASDFVSEGANALERLDTIKNWFNRRTHARATGEDWTEEINDLLLEPL
ncbi:hypothetical protein B0H16DRAFT_1790019 [Mycena metata]|uniref:DUF6589 domain-containing protein n=1 Tax=Mycena metata TaxID=1033252 RepID=A0AAD7HJA6_9AGAR|nr:hypothetical protein B0H16DRAFT_1790019 [Mycena metata]